MRRGKLIVRVSISFPDVCFVRRDKWGRGKSGKEVAQVLREIADQVAETGVRVGENSEHWVRVREQKRMAYVRAG